jgi:hypothetical protein
MAPGKRRRSTGRRMRGRVSKRRRVGRRARSSMRATRTLRLNVTRIRATGQTTLSNVTTAGFWQYYQPTINNGFNNMADFTNLFEQYRVNSIAVTFRPRFAASTVVVEATGNSEGNATTPYACIIKDPASTITPSGTYSIGTLNTLLESGGRIIRADRAFTVKWKPKIVFETGTTPSSTYYKAPPFIDIDDLGVPMRGFHLMLYTQNFSAPNTSMSWDVYVKMNVSFRNMK